MRRWLILLLVISASLSVGVNWPGLPGTGRDKMVVNGLLTDMGAEAIYGLPFFLDPPTNLTRYYVSADAGGYLPLGNDANAGTSMEAPVRSLTRAHQLTVNGGWALFDDGDTWESAADFQDDDLDGCTLNVDCNQDFTFTAFTGCADDESLCMIWSDFDLDPNTGPLSGNTRPTIDCATNSIDIGVVSGASALFIVINDAGSGEGWAAFANFQTSGCPIAGDDTGDFLAVNTGSPNKGQAILLNVSTPGLQGDLNQQATAHNSTRSRVIMLNSECTIDDADDGTQCFYAIVGSAIIIGRSNIASVTASTGGHSNIQAGKGMYSLFVMGHTLTCDSGAGVSRAIGVLNADDSFASTWTGGKRWLAAADVAVLDCDTGGDAGIFTSHNTVPSGGAIDDYVNLFKVSSIGNDVGIDVRNTAAAGTQSRYVTTRCVLVDDHSSYTARLDVTPPVSSDWDMANSVYDASDTAIAFYFDINRADVEAVQANTDFPSSDTFAMADLNGASPGPDGFCNTGAACEAACTTEWSYVFPMDDYIPKDVLGYKIRGVIKNSSKDQNIGAR